MMNKQKHSKEIRNKHQQAGFSLVEIAVVMAILGIVFVGYMVGFGSFHHSANLKESQLNEQNIKNQILNFGVVNSYLPCPDTDGDGLENRVVATGSLGSFDACAATVGGVPYLDIGLKAAEVEDGWGNSIRYAVNIRTNNAEFICNKASSASMFCNAGAATNTYWFNLVNTPPTAADRGAGNYYVCNDTTANCSAAATASQLETDTAVVVLVAYNEDGGATINSMPGCAGIASQNVDNCNVDNIYHQRAITVDSDNFFDDVITSISGYEVKEAMISKNISWNSFESADPPPSSLTPTYTNFDISATEYAADHDLIETNGDDVILINRNVSVPLDLGSGQDYIAIGNDLQASSGLSTGSDDDTVYIVGQALSSISLGDGNDSLVLGKNLAHDVNAGSGNDKVWLQQGIVNGPLVDGPPVVTTAEPVEKKDVDKSLLGGLLGGLLSGGFGSNETVTSETTVSGNVTTTEETTVVVTKYRCGLFGFLGSCYDTTTTVETTTVTASPRVSTVDLGSGDDVLWVGDESDPTSGAVVGDVSGGSGYDILVLENMTKDEWDADPSYRSEFTDFELVMFKSEGGTREYEEL